jgi:hypothetical protein
MVTDTRAFGLSGLSTFNYENCPICFNALKTKKSTIFFKCKRHKAHAKCARNYYSSDYGDSYLCPMRCSDVLI